MTKLVAVYNFKGGVGKTTIATNFAYCSADDLNARILLWDLDAQGAASFLFKRDQQGSKAKRIFSREIDPTQMISPTQWPRIDLLAADISLRHLDQILADGEKPKRLRKLLHAMAPAYKYIFIDCPPGLSELSEQIFRAVDLVVVPVLPSPLAMRSLAAIEKHLEDNPKKPRLMPVISMFDRRKRMHREFLEAHPHWPAIPQASAIERMAVKRAPVAAFDSKSRAAMAFHNLWQEAEAILEVMPLSREQAAAKKLVRIPNVQ